MTSLKQIEANRRNALRSTGPRSPEGKVQARMNGYRHGLTAETVIASLENEEGYEAFQLAITSEYDAHTVVERELVLRLASLLWRLRRATFFEAALFNAMLPLKPGNEHQHVQPDPAAACFLKLMEHPTNALDRLSRYEHALWRQARQVIETLRDCRHVSRSSRRAFRLGPPESDAE